MISYSYFAIHARMRDKIKDTKCVDCGSCQYLVVSSNNENYFKISDFAMRCHKCNMKRDLEFKKQKGLSPIRYFFDENKILKEIIV